MRVKRVEYGAGPEWGGGAGDPQEIPLTHRFPLAKIRDREDIIKEGERKTRSFGEGESFVPFPSRVSDREEFLRRYKCYREATSFGRISVVICNAPVTRFWLLTMKFSRGDRNDMFDISAQRVVQTRVRAPEIEVRYKIIPSTSEFA
ncbi:hypothetical protein PR048_002878 [Dryococelus australis]|uniref:Uncharacterized protein n=1 Tax=Dryococelus australis TaxID=614101 RepID=A0ABQ9IMH6_9NEOP|nr:hypothetical protein PR048_002878 [Dryococelus australis]